MAFRNPVHTLPASRITGQLTGAQIVDGSIAYPHLKGPLSSAASVRYLDVMDDASLWELMSSSSGTWGIQASVDAGTGGTVLQATGTVNLRGRVRIPHDPEVLYRVSFRIRTSTQGTGVPTVFLGLYGLAADGVTTVNRDGIVSLASHFYAAASSQSLPSASGWVTYTGYVQGRAAAGLSGDGGPTPLMTSPERLHGNVRYVAPYMRLDFPNPGTTGSTIQVDRVSVDAVYTGVLTAEAISVGALDGQTITGSTIQTAASGQRVVLNSSNLRAIGSNGATIGMEPNATYPFIYWTSPDLSNQAVINVTGGASEANIGVNSGTFVDSGDLVSYKWRTFFGNDFWVAERVNSSSGVANGGRLFMTKTSASLGAGPGGARVALGTGTASVESGGGAVVSLSGAQDIRAQGIFRGDNINLGTVNITPVPNVPTSVTLTGGAINGTKFRGFATANSSKPGSEVTGVGCTTVTADGMVVWLTRTVATVTTVFWMIWGEL